MKKPPAAIILSLPNPCYQDWQAMTPEAGGRFCGQCRNVVTDFTRMSDAALIAHVQQHGFGCGRFLADQLDRELRLPAVPSRPKGVGWLMGLLLLFGWMREGRAQQKRPVKPKMQQTPVRPPARLDTLQQQPAGAVKQLINPQQAPVKTSEEIERLGMHYGHDIVALSTNVYQPRAGGGLKPGDRRSASGAKAAPSPKKSWFRIRLRDLWRRK